jgi:TPR repeat protein
MKLLSLVAIIGFSVVFIGIIAYKFKQATLSAKQVNTIAFETINEDNIAGDAEAELRMGLRYAQADGVLGNAKEAISWFEKAAKHGQIEAQYLLGHALMEGNGAIQNYQTAFYWLERAAQQGHSLAQLNLGEIYRKGTGVDVNKEKAYLWFALAAESGMEKAAYARDLITAQLQPKQIAAMQQEAQRISHELSHKDDIGKPSANENEDESSEPVQ